MKTYTVRIDSAEAIYDRRDLLTRFGKLPTQAKNMYSRKILNVSEAMKFFKVGVCIVAYDGLTKIEITRES
jgi:hypothetical protein